MEYFVTHFHEKFPPCRNFPPAERPTRRSVGSEYAHLGKQTNHKPNTNTGAPVDGIDVWSKKPCFKNRGCLIAARDSKYRNNLTTPIDPEIEYDKNVCNHDKLEGGCDFHALDSICEGMSPACITNPCPEVLLVADCRCSVGDFFSDVEKKQFEEKTEILSQPNFKLQSENDLGLSDEKAAYAHEALRDEFDGLKKYPNRYGHIVFMVKCLEIADRVKRAAKNKQRSSPAESTVEANVDSIETTGELSSVTIFGISDNAEKKLRKILDDYHNRINETDVEKWDRLSREKFDDMGWTELAKMELEKQEGKTPSKKVIRRLSDQIRKKVGLHRSKYQ